MIFLLRHAHSDYAPDEMRALSLSGRAAAARVADVLAGRGVSRIISSPYTRARQTVEPLARRLGIEIEREPDLRERKLTDGPAAGDFRDYLAATWEDFNLAYPGGETSNDRGQAAGRLQVGPPAGHGGEGAMRAWAVTA